MAHPHEFNDEEIDPAGAPPQERDPVCGMTVDPASALRLAEQGRNHYFCSPHCLNRFSRRSGPIPFRPGENGSGNVGKKERRRSESAPSNRRRPL